MGATRFGGFFDKHLKHNSKYKEMKILAFDIGIRNLAWCMLEQDLIQKRWIIHGWENYDLIAGMTTQDAKYAAKVLCMCGKTAGFTSADKPSCVRCCPATHPALRDASGALVKTLPTVSRLKALLGTPRPGLKGRADILAALGKKFSLPLQKVKPPRGEDLVGIHNSMQTFAKDHKELFRGATHILLENQPAFKNPTMKSVQILLFATLRDILDVPGQPVSFVHAGKKVKGGATGDEGYKSRKKGGEDRVKEFFEKETVTDSVKWKEYYGKQQKKSDLCDAMCMCIDRILA